ncbi:MAG: IS1380 family transposase [PVC group bacterium]
MITIPQQAVLFPELFSRPVSVSFSRDHLSSDGGSILLKAVDQKLGLTQLVAETFIDRRQPEKIRHEILDLTRQRLFSLASGYPDCNDAGRLKQDPVLKLMCDRDPITGDDLGSQPTLSRFENSVTRFQLLELSTRLAEKVLRHQQSRRRGKHKPKRIIIDIDPTHDATHGQQQMTFFNGYYDTWCYLPLVVTISFNKERRKYPIAVILRPGNAGAMTGTLAILKRLVPRIRSFFPKGRLFFRADGAYCNPDLLDWLEEKSIYYTIPIGSNPVLERISAPWMDLVRQATHLHGKSVTIYREDSYQAGTWSHPRRLVYKAEVLVQWSDYRDNARYTITTLPHNLGAEGVFRFYYGHSDIENSIKDFKNDLSLDRTSCTSFLANQLRVIWSLSAYILMQALQERISDPILSRATMGTLRERLFKIAVRVKESTRQITFLLTTHYPWQGTWLACARSVGAVAG